MVRYRLAKLFLGVVYSTLVFGGLLFLPAGTLAWWRAWVFLGVAIAFVALSALTLPQGLLDERSKPPLQKGQPLADKILLAGFLASSLALFAFIALDVFRWNVLGAPCPAVSLLGLALVCAGAATMYLAFRENAFAAPVVRHQEERGQTVIDTGVYRVVRHPMYTGLVLVLVGAPLWLESYAAAVLSLISIATLAVRIVYEERFLRRRLAGYADYMQRARYRLIPFVW